MCLLWPVSITKSCFLALTAPVLSLFPTFLLHSLKGYFSLFSFSGFQYFGNQKDFCLFFSFWIIRWWQCFFSPLPICKVLVLLGFLWALIITYFIFFWILISWKERTVFSWIIWCLWCFFSSSSSILYCKVVAVVELFAGTFNHLFQFVWIPKLFGLF